MNSTSRMRAKAILSLAIQIAPPERLDWFEATLSEMDYIPDADLPRFAFGCMIAAIQSRIVSPKFILVTLRWLLVCAAITWAGLNVWLAGRLSVADSPALEAFTYCIAAIFALGAIATARFGFMATIGLGVPLSFVFVVAALTIKMTMPNLPDATLYIALIVEDLAVLLLALFIAIATLRSVTVNKAIGQ